MKIVLGQYYPGNSILHRLDPRTKLIGLVALMTMAFMSKTAWAYALLGTATILLVFLSQVPIKTYLRGLRTIIGLLVFVTVLNMFFATGEKLLFSFGFIKVYQEGLIQAGFVIVRVVILVFISTVLTLTTPPIALADGLEYFLSPLSKIGVPAHEIAMMMTIALRFIPNLMEEMDRIIKAQKARGANLETKGIINRIKSLIPLLVPLFVSAFKKADDLALAMEARCYNGGIGRTRIHPLHFDKSDVGSFAFLSFLFLVFMFIK